MERFATYLRADAESVDIDKGTFEAVLFTNGESEDGHILRMGGGEIPRRMPMFEEHIGMASRQLGTFSLLKRSNTQATFQGEIRTTGVGDRLENRLDLLDAISSGEVRDVSGAWTIIDRRDVRRRTDLPPSHPAAVPESDQTRRRFGLFFSKWRAVEGSVVGQGSDPRAKIRGSRAHYEAEEWFRNQDPRGIVACDYSAGKRCFVPRELAAELEWLRFGQLKG